jgi:hypothetical protein
MKIRTGCRAFPSVFATSGMAAFIEIAGLTLKTFSYNMRGVKETVT